MDIEAVIAKVLKPYEERMEELLKAEKQKEKEIKELKTSIFNMSKLLNEYQAQQVSGSKPKPDPKTNQVRPQTAVLPNRGSKPESISFKFA